jgi:hypothetical protein
MHSNIRKYYFAYISNNMFASVVNFGQHKNKNHYVAPHLGLYAALQNI